MSLYLDPDCDRMKDGPLFDLPQDIAATCPGQTMHAAAVVIGPYGILLRGESGSGKSLLQRSLRRQAEALSIASALVSDDYVMLVRMPEVESSGPGDTGEDIEPPELRAYGPVATRGLQEVRGLGIVAVGDKNHVAHAAMHLLVDLCDPDAIDRMPSRQDREQTCLGYPIAHLSVPKRSVVEACDVIFTLLSTWKGPL
nr:hypothetical protein [uncultured Cohaesibacter sp.]